ncbi:replication initiation protein [Endozoicomonas sp.]|uniref:replication initiation protein n=1 Tax=Endozoicomonas sp. TaxID=1892382 RepID=UPI002888249D|nr:replication initiation protein [Endozoicomonas sp.]
MARIMTDIDHIKITKANQVVEIKLLEVGTRLKMRDQKVILAVVGQISPDDEDFKNYRITINELISLTGISKENLYRDIHSICTCLTTSAITIKEPSNPKGFLVTAWFSHAEYLPSDGLVEFAISPKLKPYLLQMKSSFTTYHLNQVAQLKSTYSFRLYELFRQFLPLNGVNNGRQAAFRDITLKDLREYLGVEKGRYPKFYDFRRYVLERSQAELKLHTDLMFDFNPVRKGRKVDSIKFKIGHNEKFVEVESEESIVDTVIPSDAAVHKDAMQYILSFIPDATSKQILTICRTYPREVFLEGLLDLMKAQSAGVVKGSDINYYIGILKNKRREDQAATKPESKSTEEKLTDRSWAEGLDLD